MEDLCKQSVEHGICLWILEADEQGTEACEAKIYRSLLQSPIQQFGGLLWTVSIMKQLKSKEIRPD
jgi:hypothetical protein